MERAPTMSWSVGDPDNRLAPLDLLNAIPEETLWLEALRSPQRRQAYRNDVAGSMTFLGISTPQDLRKVARPVVIAVRWDLERANVQPATIRRKLAALSSLFTHLVGRQVVQDNSCRETQRSSVNRREGTTSASSQEEARALLDLPDETTPRGLRDRALLSVGFQAGARRTSIVHLNVHDLHRQRGSGALSFVWKGGQAHALTPHPQTAQRIRDYLLASEHAEDLDGSLFRPIVRTKSAAHRLHPQEVNRVFERDIKEEGLEGRYSAHSMRATFIAAARDNGASLEEVPRAAENADPSTTKLSDRRGHSPDRSAAFSASY